MKFNSRGKIIKGFRVLTGEILNELSEKEINSSAIRNLYLVREMKVMFPMIVESRAMNKHDTPEAYEIAYIRDRLEVYLDIFIKVKDEIQSKHELYRAFDYEIQEDLQNYIDWGLRLLNNQKGNFRNYTEDYFRIPDEFCIKT